MIRPMTHEDPAATSQGVPHVMVDGRTLLVAGLTAFTVWWVAEWAAGALAIVASGEERRADAFHWFAFAVPLLLALFTASVHAFSRRGDAAALPPAADLLAVLLALVAVYVALGSVSELAHDVFGPTTPADGDAVGRAVPHLVGLLAPIALFLAAGPLARQVFRGRVRR